jgi:hypothetical protein
VVVTKTKKRTKGALLLESLKSNKKTDNQHADLPDCYMEGRHNMQSTTSDSLTTPKSKYWPPEELDDLYQIISTTRADGELEETEFNSRMTAIFGTVSKKSPPSSSIVVTSKHILQLKAFRQTLQQDDRVYVDVWLSNLKLHEKKQGI